MPGAASRKTRFVKTRPIWTGAVTELGIGRPTREGEQVLLRYRCCDRKGGDQ